MTINPSDRVMLENLMKDRWLNWGQKEDLMPFMWEHGPLGDPEDGENGVWVGAYWGVGDTQELRQTDEHVSDPQHKKTPGKGPPHQSQALLWLGLEQSQAFPNPQGSALRPEGQSATFPLACLGIALPHPARNRASASPKSARNRGPALANPGQHRGPAHTWKIYSMLDIMMMWLQPLPWATAKALSGWLEGSWPLF